MSRKLRVIAGPDEGTSLPLPESGAVILGRGKGTLGEFKDKSVSRQHCRLEVNGNQVVIVITNNGSSRTLLNSEPVTAQKELQLNDVISLGEETQLKFEEEDYRDEQTQVGGQLAHEIRKPQTSLAGSTLAHFQLGKPVAEAATGTVFLATDKRTGREVALKVFSLPTLLQLPGFPGILQPLLNIQHPNLVNLYEADRTGAHCWIATEYVEGETLEKYFQQSGLAGTIDWRLTLRFGIELASALDALHQRHVTHRNVTPGSVLITRADRQAKLGSLWRARALKDADAKSDNKDVLRNAVYMAPERLVQNQPSSLRGDIYSLGALLYTLLAGRPPFEGKSDEEVIAKVARSEPVSLRAFQPSLSASFERVVLRMMAKQPAERFANAAEVLTALRRLEGGSVESSAPAPAPDKISVTCKCGQELQARKQFAGTRVRCPCCGTFILLPGKGSFMSPLDQSIVKSHLSSPTPPPPQKTPSAIQPRAPRSILREAGGYGVVIALLLLALVLTLAGVLWDRSMPPDKSTEPNPPAKSEPKATPK